MRYKRVIKSALLTIITIAIIFFFIGVICYGLDTFKNAYPIASAIIMMSFVFVLIFAVIFSEIYPTTKNPSGDKKSV